MFPDSKIAGSYACARTKSAAITKCLADHYSTDLIKKLRTQPFSLSTDGSNDGGSSQIYPLVVRFFDKVKGAVVTQLLNVVECVGPSTDVRNFYSGSLAYIVSKFPLDDEVLEHAKVLDVARRGNVKEASVSLFSQRFGFIPKEMHEALLLEFARYKLEPFDASILEEPDVGRQWHAISQMENLDHVQKFPLLCQVMVSVLCIPPSNADSERIFFNGAEKPYGISCLNVN